MSYKLSQPRSNSSPHSLPHFLVFTPKSVHFFQLRQNSSVIHISYTRKMQCALIIVCCFSKKMWLPKPNRQCPWPLNEMFQRTTVLKMPPCTEELLWEWNLVDEDKQLSTDVYSQHILHQILHVFSNTTSPTLQHQLGISYNSIHFWPYSIRSRNIRTQSYKTVSNSNTSPRLSSILLNSQL